MNKAANSAAYDNDYYLLSVLLIFFLNIQDIRFETYHFLTQPVIKLLQSLLQRYQLVADKDTTGLFNVTKTAGIVGNNAHHLRGGHGALPSCHPG